MSAFEGKADIVGLRNFGPLSAREDVACHGPWERPTAFARLSTET